MSLQPTNAADEVGVGDGPITPEAPGPPNILPQAYFLLPVWLAGCAALLFLAAPNLLSYLANNL